MKIGLIGNMNNNNFALMRYFRDLGADAHLLLYVNDGKGSLSHFRPENDTWEIEKWQPYIHQTSIPNAPVAALDFPLSNLMSFSGWCKKRIGKNPNWLPPVSKSQIRRAYSGYDCLIGSGITPATLSRVGISLDIFYPYAVGVEFLDNYEYQHLLEKKSYIRKLLFLRIYHRQKRAVQKSNFVCNAEMGLTDQVLRSHGVEPEILAIPMVYNRAVTPDDPIDNIGYRLLDRLSACDMSILHTARLLWVKARGQNEQDWPHENKNNHWLLLALADLIAQRPDFKPLLLMVDYGPDAAATRQLSAELGLARFIEWLPRLGRRELMWLLSRVSISVGEFYEVDRTLWGGTGWEALSAGKPLLQGFRYEPGEFRQLFGNPPPPMLPVSRKEDILKHFLQFADNPEGIQQIGFKAREWFDRYNGIGLARKWLDLLERDR